MRAGSGPCSRTLWSLIKIPDILIILFFLHTLRDSRDSGIVRKLHMWVVLLLLLLQQLQCVRTAYLYRLLFPEITIYLEYSQIVQDLYILLLLYLIQDFLKIFLKFYIGYLLLMCLINVIVNLICTHVCYSAIMYVTGYEKILNNLRYTIMVLKYLNILYDNS